MKYFVRTSLCLLLVLLATTACKQSEPEAKPSIVIPQSTPAATSPTPAPVVKNEADSKQIGFLAAGNTGALFIQWTELDNKLTGQLINSYIVANSDPLKVDSVNASFTGIHNANAISLTLNGKTLTGTLEKNQLTLVFPNSNGTLESHVLVPGTVDDYNKAVLAMQSSTKDMNAKEAQLKADADRIYKQQKAVNDANKRLGSVLSDIDSAAKDLASEATYDDILKDYEETWNKMKADYAQLKSDASVKPLTGVQLGTVQVDLGTMQVDHGTFQTRGGSMQVRNTSITNRIKDIQGSIKAAQDTWKTLQAAVANDTTGTKAQFTADDLTNAINAGQKQIDSASGIIQAAQAKQAEYDQNDKSTLAEATQFVKGLKATD